MELANFAAVSGDSRVTLNWRTASKSNNDRFDIVRDGKVVTQMDALNLATGADYSWTDRAVTNGTTYSYTLVAVDNLGERTTLRSVAATPATTATGMATEYALYQNYPNPFNPTTTIAFDLLESGLVSLKVYNLIGQNVATVLNGTMGAGHHLATFDARNLPSGLYLYRLETNGFSAEKKMLLMK